MESKSTVWQRTRAFQIVFIVALALLVGFAMGSQFSVLQAQNGFQLSEEQQEAFEPLFQAFSLIEGNYVDEVEANALIDGAITGMVDTLDVHSGYVTPEFAPYVDSRLAGEFEGIGATIIEIEETGEVEVLNVFEGSPAEQSGIQPGDIFFTVNGNEVIGLSTLELAARVRGPAGTTVDITMRRGEEFIDFTIERARIEITYVESEVLDGDIGYLSLSSFSSNAREQINQALTELNVNELNGLIFDLRNNGGGFLDTGLEVASLLIDDGILLLEKFGTGEERIFRVEEGIVYQVFDDESERIYSNEAAFGNINVPVVLLVNENSASASELVAGAWQETGTATLIGTTTFGKGTVQQVIELSNSGNLRLTIARWFTPNGNTIHGEGITPDIIVEMPEEEVDDEEILEEGEDANDPQLDAAIEFIQGAFEPISGN